MATSEAARVAGRLQIAAAQTHQASARGRWLGIRPAHWATVILGAMLCFTIVAFLLVRTENQQASQFRFDQRASEIEDAITQRMIAYTSVLRGALGLFNASERVTREEWRTYVEAIDIDTVLPGIQGIGYAEFVAPSEKARYEQAIRDEGFADFRIRPEGTRPIYSSITFLEPFDERNRQAFGFDMYQHETRQAAMDRARDSGRVAISGRVVLVQEISEDVQAGFLMYLPYYGRDSAPSDTATRRREIVGYVYSPFRMGNLMAGILGVGLPDVRLEVFDGKGAAQESLMYDSDPSETPRMASFVDSRTLDIAQSQWTLRISSLASFEADGRGDEEFLILGGGIALSFLLFGIVRSFASTRERAQALADSMTIQLQENSKELERSNAELELFAYVASHDLKAPLRGIDHLANWIETDLGDDLSGEPKQNMTLLRGRIKRLDKLLDDLLSYSRAHRDDSAPEEVDFGTTAQYWFDALDMGERFDLHLDVLLQGVHVRSAALEQILNNLFSNSKKHHDQARGNIFIAADEDATFYEIRYEDDGPGIPADQRERAFQMFQTLQPRDKVEGSGMGLAIVKKIIEHDGGTISCEDRPDGARGVFFRIRWAKS